MRVSGPEDGCQLPDQLDGYFWPQTLTRLPDTPGGRLSPAL